MPYTDVSSPQPKRFARNSIKLKGGPFDGEWVAADLEDGQEVVFWRKGKGHLYRYQDRGWDYKNRYRYRLWYVGRYVSF